MSYHRKKENERRWQFCRVVDASKAGSAEVSATYAADEFYPHLFINWFTRIFK
jgi:hypothetical protein